MKRVRAIVGGAVRRLRGQPRVGQQVTRSKLRLGSEYGGYAIIPDLLSSESIVYSFGIGEDASFDLELIERFGCSVHAFDPTPRSLAWVSSSTLPAQFVVHAFGLAATDGMASFTPPKNPAHVSHRLVETDGGAQATEFPVRRLTTLMQQLGHDRIDVLKMDVESAEYAVIDALPDSNVRPTQILVEFHHQFKDIPLTRTERALARLNALGYRVFDAQPGGHEFSLVRIDPSKEPHPSCPERTPGTQQ